MAGKKVAVAGKFILKYLFLLVTGAILGTLLIMLAYAIPTNDKTVNVSMANADFMSGGYPLANVQSDYSSHFASFEAGVLDDATDMLILSNVFDNSEGSLLWRAMYMQGYTRYWHGYVSLLRPILYFVNYFDLRLLNGMLQMGLIVLLAIVIWQETGQKRYVLALLTSYALLTPLALSMSLQFSPVFYISMLGSLAVSRKYEKLLEKSRYLYFFIILGMLTTYFDFLTYPLLAWAFPMCWMLVFAGQRLTAGGRLKIVVSSAISWGIGYAGFFLMKWVLAVLVCGYETFMVSVHSAMNWFGNIDSQYQEYFQTYERYEVLYTNWRHYQFAGYMIIISAWILWALFHLIKNNWKVDSGIAALLLTTLSSPAYYLVLSRHTTHHHFFTYRIYGASILAFILLLCECVPGRGESVCVKWKASVGRAVLAVCLFLAGWGLSFLAKGNIGNFFGGDYQQFAMGEGDVFEAEFQPIFDNVKVIGFCIAGDNPEKGYYSVEVVDDGESLYRLELSMSEHAGYAYHEEMVDWRLDAGKKYSMRISFHDIGSANCYLFLTLDGSMPIPEYGKALMNGIPLAENVEPLGCISYHASILDKQARAYIALVCGGYLTVLAMAVITAARHGNKARSVVLRTEKQNG